MNKKISVLFVMLLMCLSAILIIPSEFDVEATGGGEGEEDIGLDYDYIWGVIEDFAGVVHNDSLWGSGDDVIRKGRTFGTPGDNWTADYINETLNVLGLDNVKKIQLETLGLSDGYILPWNCDYKVETIDFNLKINHPAWPFTEDGHIPKNETSVIPSGTWNRIPGTPGYNSMDYNRSFNQMKLKEKKLSKNLIREGATSNNYLNVSIKDATMPSLIIGNVTYISINESLPEDQEDRIFIFGEEEWEWVEDQLENVTNASTVILIHDDTKGAEQQDWADTTNCTSAVLRVDISSSNMTNIIEMLENGTFMIADNLLDNTTLTFTHNFSYITSWWPNYDFLLLSAFSGDADDILTGPSIMDFYNEAAKIMGWGLCYGIILYDVNEDTHVMERTSRHWRGWDNRNPINAALRYITNDPRLQVFSINKTVGVWLNDRVNDPDLTATGYFEQADNNIDAFNVIGNITIKESPGDAIVIISNRYDGWWSEAPGDSGVGGGIVMGIAKYMKEYEIKPKYNISFLFTTGEEYGMRGAWYHSMSRPNENITRWIGTDQLSFNWSNMGQVTLLSDNRSDGDGGIIDAIVDITNLVEDSGYGYRRVLAEDPAGTDEAAFRWRYKEFGFKCDTICIHRARINTSIGPKWYYHHRAGKNYTEGDSMKYIDRDDVNATFNYTWGVVKYYTVNPDCWFVNVSYKGTDSISDMDDLPDTIKVNFSVNTILPIEEALVKIILYRHLEDEIFEVLTKYMNLTIIKNGIEKTLSVSVPKELPEGDYSILLELYNSTGRTNDFVNIGLINYNDSHSSDVFHLFPSGRPEPDNMIISILIIIIIIILAIFLFYLVTKRKKK